MHWQVWPSWDGGAVFPATRNIAIEKLSIGFQNFKKKLSKTFFLFCKSKMKNLSIVRRLAIWTGFSSIFVIPFWVWVSYFEFLISIRPHQHKQPIPLSGVGYFKMTTITCWKWHDCLMFSGFWLEKLTNSSIGFDKSKPHFKFRTRDYDRFS